MKDMQYYRNTGVAYPGRDQYTKVFVYKAGLVLVDGLLQSVMPPADIKLHQQQGHTIEYVFDEQGYNAALLMYFSAEQSLQDEFKEDLFEECGVTKNPKAELLFSKAWNRGHAGGFGDVHSIFHDLVDLIK